MTTISRDSSMTQNPKPDLTEHKEEATTSNSATKTQADRFIEASRQAGADEDEGAFKAKLAAITRQKPAP